MPRKRKSSSSKTAKEPKASASVAVVTEEEKKPSPAPKKSGNEIDEIFSGKKRKKVESEKPAEDATERPTKDIKKLGKKRSKISQEGGFGEPFSRPRKRTEDGLAVYTAEELGIGKGDAGGTPLCPFDCSCCF